MYWQLDYFKLTAKKIDVSRLMRTQGFVTNGYWCIKEQYESPLTSKLRDTQQYPDVNKVIENALKNELVQVEMTNNFHLQGEMVVELQPVEPTDKIINVWLNVYFMAMLIKQLPRVDFYFTGDYSPVLLIGKGEKPTLENLLGLVMPVRQ